MTGSQRVTQETRTLELKKRAGSRKEDGIQQHEPLRGAFACRSQGIRESSLASVTKGRMGKRKRAQVSGHMIWRGAGLRVPGIGRAQSVCV